MRDKILSIDTTMIDRRDMEIKSTYISKRTERKLFSLQ